MENCNDTVKDVCDKSLRNIIDTFGKRVRVFDGIADDIEAAHEREIAVKDAEIEKLRALVKEMADKLHSEHCCDDGSHFDGCNITDICHNAETCALVARARDVIGGVK